jgi:hypothetical protein
MELWQNDTNAACLRVAKSLVRRRPLHLLLSHDGDLAALYLNARGLRSAATSRGLLRETFGACRSHVCDENAVVSV